MIDLGSAPGSWSQYAANKIKNGKILSIDLKNIENIKNTHQIVGNFMDIKNQIQIKEFFGDKVDVIL